MLTHLNCPPIRANQLSMGYAAELAARFRCSSVYEFCSDFGISFPRLARGDQEELGRFAALTRNDLDNLRMHSTIHLPDGSIRLGHAVLAKHVLTRSTVRVCPDCVAKDIAENAGVTPDIAIIWRRNWLVSAIDTCPIHSRPLSAVARITASNLQWDATLAWSDLSGELDELLASPARREPHGLQNYSIERIEGRGEPVAALDVMPLHTAIVTCAQFGRLNIGADRRWKDLAEHTRHLAYRSGFDVLSRGPDAIGALVERRLSEIQDGTHGYLGASTLLKHVHLFLKGTLDDPAFDQLRNAVANAVFDVLPIGPEDEPVLGVNCTRRRTYSLSAASQKFGLQERTFALYAEAAGVGVRNAHGRLIIDAEKANEFFGESGGFINIANVGKEIGARGPSLEAFVEAGLLTPLSTENTRERQHLPVRRKDVSQLMSRFMDKSVVLPSAPEGTIALPDLHRRFRKSYSMVHELVLSGAIWLGRVDGPKVYASLHVSIAEVSEHYKNRHSAQEKDGERHGTFEGPQQALLDLFEAAAIAGINHESLRILAAENLIPTMTVINPKTGFPKRMYSPHDMENFAAEHISLTVLARNNKVRPSDLRPAIERMKIATAFDERCGSRIYRRQDLSGTGLAV